MEARCPKRSNSSRISSTTSTPIKRTFLAMVPFRPAWKRIFLTDRPFATLGRSIPSPTNCQLFRAFQQAEFNDFFPM